VTRVMSFDKKRDSNHHNIVSQRDSSRVSKNFDSIQVVDWGHVITGICKHVSRTLFWSYLIPLQLAIVLSLGISMKLLIRST